MAKANGQDPQKVLKNIFVARAYNSLPADEQVYILNDNDFHKIPIGELVKTRKDHDITTFAFNPNNGKMALGKVTSLISHPLPRGETFYKIKAGFGKEVIVTGSYSLFKGVRIGKKGRLTVRRERQNMRPVSVEARELKVGDYITVPKYLPMFEKNIKYVDLAEKLQERFEDFDKEIMLDKNFICLKHTGKHEANKIPRKIKIDDDILWLLGLVVAEGNAQYGNSLLRLRMNSNHEFLKKAQKIIKEKFNIESHMYLDRRLLFVGSRLLCLIIKHCFKIPFDLKASKRYVPEWIFQLPKSKLKHFVKGLWDGDGYHKDTRRKKRLIFTTSSRQLANDITLLLLRYGIVGSIIEIKMKNMKKNWNTQYRVEAAGLNTNNPLDLESTKQNIGNVPTWNDMMFVKIKSIENVALKANKVYDLEVHYNGQEYENFLGGFGGVICHNSEHQILLVEKAQELIEEKNIGLIIVDSLTSHFRSDFVGRGELAERQQKLNKHLHALQRLADAHNIAVYITNQVMTDPAMMFGDPTKPVGGHILGHQCVAPDTLVQLSNGEVIEAKYSHNPLIFSGIDFATLKQSEGRTNGVFRTKKDMTVEINSSLRVSPEHTVFKVNGLDIVEVEAKYLQKNDYLVVPRKINIKGSELELPKIEVERVFLISSKGSKIIRNEAKKRNISLNRNHTDLFGIAPRQLRRVLNQGYPTREGVIRKIERSFGIDLSNFTKEYETQKHKKIKIPKKINKNIAQIFGYFIGDGNLFDNTLSFRDLRRHVLAKYKKLLFKEFGLKCSLRPMKNKNCFELEVNNKYLAELFRTLKNEYLFISKGTEDCINGFIRGIFDAEGSLTNNKLSLTNSDKRLLEFTKLLLLRFGIHSKLNKAGNIFRLSIIGDVNKFFAVVGLTANDKTRKLKEISSKREIVPIKRELLNTIFRKYGIKTRVDLKYITRDYLEKLNQKYPELNKIFSKLLNSDIAFEKITKIKVQNNRDELIDISIPGTENFIANGYVVHNSTYRMYLRRGREGTRVARMVDAPNLIEAEAVFKITEDGIRDTDYESKSK